MRASVRVPVLSKATVRTPASASRAAELLKSTPPRAAAAIAESITAGVLITTAQGLATTMKVIARYHASSVGSPKPRRSSANTTGTASSTVRA